MSKSYTTVQGDTWDSIAYRELGDTAYTDKLQNLNSVYRDYYIFPAGVVLELPDAVTVPTNTLPPWKQVAG
jgi:phage tail protein X